MKPAFVYGLLLIPKDRKLAVCHEGGRQYRLPGGQVEEGESEKDALSRLVEAQAGIVVTVVETIGPLYGGGGLMTQAYDCNVEGGGDVLMRDRPMEVCFVTLKEFLALSVQDSVQRRMILDGFSIMDPPEIVGESPFGTVEGVYLSDDGTKLVEDRDDERLIYRRIDPDSPTGYME